MLHSKPVRTLSREAFVRQLTAFVALAVAALASLTLALGQGIDGGDLANVPNAPLENGVQQSFRIGVGDVLAVNVWREPDVSLDSVIVRPDGKISLPLIKEIYVAGLTPVEAEKDIASKFEQYINNPVVTVILRDVRSQLIFLVGGLQKTGSILYKPGMTVLEAIGEGGGLTDYAKKKKIYVVRELQGKRYKMDYDYPSVMAGDTEKDVVLRAGDTVVVPD